jgi:hypothetical protein
MDRRPKPDRSQASPPRETSSTSETSPRQVDALKLEAFIDSFISALGLDRGYTLVAVNPKASDQLAAYGFRAGFSAAEVEHIRELVGGGALIQIHPTSTLSCAASIINIVVTLSSLFRDPLHDAGRLACADAHQGVWNRQGRHGAGCIHYLLHNRLSNIQT